jgi:acetyl-CoA acetyltransferase
MCASGQSAIRYAYACVASGLSDIAVAFGVEKMNMPNKIKIIQIILGGWKAKDICILLFVVSPLQQSLY